MRKILKVLNSSVVLIDSNQQKMIALGKGIGFGKKPGEIISDDSIDEIYLPYDEGKAMQLLDLIKEVPLTYFELTKAMVSSMEKRLGKRLNSSIYLTLPDHLHFSVERMTQGIIITNRLYWEIKNYYPEEYQAAEEALMIFNEKSDVELPIEEAANIAFHVINSLSQESQGTDSMKQAKMIGGIVNLVKYSIRIDIAPDSIHYSRFITHVRFFVERLFANKMLDGQDDGLYQQMCILYPLAMENADKVRQYIQKMIQQEITNEEVTYLGVHINRLMRHPD